MAETLTLEIVTPDGVKLRESVDELTAPGVEGEFGVLPRHRPLLTALTSGIVNYKKDGKSSSVAIGSGFAEVLEDRAVLLTDRFATPEDIDPVRVRLDLKEADEELERFSGDPASPEYGALVQRELWAATQLELHGDPPPARIRAVGELGFGAGESYRVVPADDDAPPEH